MILVTGAGGTVGGEVLKQLRAGGVPVRGAFNNPKKAAVARAQGIDTVGLDYTDRSSIAAALQGVDKIFLIVATLPKQWELEKNVAEESRKAGVKHIVKLSVLDCDKEDYIFGRWHRAGERAIETVGLPHTFLRPTGFMQNFVNFSAATIKGQGAIYAPDEAPHTAVDVRDIAAVAVKALTGTGHDGKIYDLTGPAVLTNSEAAKTIADAIGKPVKFVPISWDAYRQGALGAGIPEFYADALVDLDQYYARGKATRVSDDIQKVTGGKPHSFEQFVRDNVQAFQ